MTLNESAITTPDLLREWTIAHERLTAMGVPVSDGPDGALWSLPSRVSWLEARLSEANGLAGRMRSALDRFEDQLHRPRG